MKTKIVATIGPASDNEMMLREMIFAGMNVARLNFSHGSHEEHKERIRRIRAAGEISGKTVAIMLDTKGPEIRVRDLKEPIAVCVGENYTLTAADTKGEGNTIPLTYRGIAKNVSVGDRILIDDGNLSFVVIEVEDAAVICKAENSGEVLPRKGINIPGHEVNLPALTEKDKKDLLFGIYQEVDFIAASFIRNPSHVQEIKDFLREHGSEIPIIAKIESRAGVDALESIVKVADGIMVARGDLGVEIPLAEVPSVQKKIISLCNSYGKPVITATQMLESMIKNPRPTRAEVSDVANAILDGTDAVMLSGESAVGKYPLAAVKAMKSIGEAAEKNLDYSRFLHQKVAVESVTSAMGQAAVSLSENLNAAALVIPSNSGETPRKIARFRPKIQMIVTSHKKEVCRRLALTWGVTCEYQPYAKGYDDTIHTTISTGKAKGFIKTGDFVLVIVGANMGFSQKTNSIFAVTVD